ncbi:hypothetical protein M5G25_10955 [Pseudomonas sp. TNT2022 ID357]|uniref:Methyl-accepting chemotaxis protein n=1 Tax=Pseudomonas idahonensis TaxID=2942628 RepID=A0ABT5Q466_9PSED|nr:hypothetical protein [Pseudomonas idahonensis]MDD1148810.1 hypothetical protein [Pseudomonas idahonensis]
MKIAVIVWALLLSTLVLLNQAEVSRLGGQSEAGPHDAKIALLETQVANLSQAIQDTRQQAMEQLKEHTDRSHQDLKQKLATIESALNERLAPSSLLPLLAQIEALAARVDAPREAASITPPRHIAQTKKIKPQVPPFTINGVELRGSERFLVILPSGSSTLGEATLLRQGESTAGWQLDAIDGATAVFIREDRALRLAIP